MNVPRNQEGDARSSVYSGSRKKSARLDSYNKCLLLLWSRVEPVWCPAAFYSSTIETSTTIRCKPWDSTLNNEHLMIKASLFLVNGATSSISVIYWIIKYCTQLNRFFSLACSSPTNKIPSWTQVSSCLALSSSICCRALGLSYTVSSADHRIQYQSFEIPLERVAPTAMRRDPYSVLHASHKHFIPPANQQCRIPLEDDILIEIFLNKTKRGKPVRSRWSLRRGTDRSSPLAASRRNCAISGSIRSFWLTPRCNRFWSITARNTPRVISAFSVPVSSPNVATNISTPW